MERFESTPETEELLGVLDHLSRLLRLWGEDRWAEWVERDRRLICDGHPDALGHLLAAFGGPDSLRDVTIHPVNGHAIGDDRIRPVNDRLRMLCSAAVSNATSLRRRLESQPE